MKIFRLEFGFHRKHNRKALSRYWRPRRLTQEGEPKIFKWLWFYFSPAPKYRLMASWDCGCSYRLHTESYSLKKLKNIGAGLDEQWLRWTIEKGTRIIDYCSIHESMIGTILSEREKEEML